MKSNFAKLLAVLLAFSLLLGGCAQPGADASTTAATTAKAATTAAPAPATTTTAAAQTSTTPGAAPAGDVWNLSGWPENPVDGTEIPGWEFLPAMSDEFKFRQTDPSIQREMEGNMYKQGYPLVKEPETLTALGRQSASIIDVTTDHWLMKRVEEQSNVHIDWQLIPEASWAEGRNLALASGDLTDIIIGGGFTKSEQLLYGEQQGLFVDLKPYLGEEYTLYLSHLFGQRPDMLDYITTPSGKVFGLFSNACNYHVSMGHKMWVNTGWLQTLGLEKPETIDEFTEMLRAFKTGDPNGNGQADELPLVGSPKGWNSRIDDFIVNAFTFHPVQANYLVAYDDVATMSIVQDEYREALAYIYSLYQEGLIDKDSFVRDGASLSSLGLAQDYDIIGAFPGGYYGTAGYNILHTEPRSEVWEPISPLEGPDGLRICYKDPFGSLAEGLFVVTKAAANPALCVRWIDYFYNPMSDIGIQGEDWEFAKAGEKNLFFDKQGYYKPLNANFDGRSENKRVESMGFPYAYVSFEHRAMPVAENANGYDALMYNWTREYYVDYANDRYFPASFFVPLDAVEDYNDALTEIKEYAAEMATKFMTGEADLNKDWSTYLDTVKSLGLDTVLKQAQAAYDNFYGLK